MKITVNDREVTVASGWLEESLLVFLRDELGLTGAKNGCNIGLCGACTILIDNKPKLACKTKVKSAIDKTIITIEGFKGADGKLHPLQQAFIDSGAIQCGYCTPAMVLRAHGFLAQKSQPTRAQIRKAISPNLCRCTGYQQIIDAIEFAVKYY